MALVASIRAVGGRRSAAAALFCAGLLPATAAAERLYEDGPLKAAEFQASPPAGQPYQARTSTRLQYKFKYRTLNRAGRSKAVLAEMRLSNVFHRDQSWNRRPDDKRLLDHEQGHFDITQAVRLRAARHWRRRVNRLAATGRTEREAVAKLEAQLKEEMRPFFDRSAALHRAYDQDTSHGLAAAAQTRWRTMLNLAIQDPDAPLPVATKQPEQRAPANSPR